MADNKSYESLVNNFDLTRHSYLIRLVLVPVLVLALAAMWLVLIVVGMIYHTLNATFHMLWVCKAILLRNLR